MTKRIFISKFRFYIHLGSFPLLVFGLLLAIYPKFFFDLIKLDNSFVNYIHLFFYRMMGVFFIYSFATFVYMGWHPNYNRDLAFFQSLLFLVCGILTSVSPFLWNFSYWIWIVSIYMFSFGIFLILFSSKNLLVKD